MTVGGPRLGKGCRDIIGFQVVTSRWVAEPLSGRPAQRGWSQGWHGGHQGGWGRPAQRGWSHAASRPFQAADLWQSAGSGDRERAADRRRQTRGAYDRGELRFQRFDLGRQLDGARTARPLADDAATGRFVGRQLDLLLTRRSSSTSAHLGRSHGRSGSEGALGGGNSPVDQEARSIDVAILGRCVEESAPVFGIGWIVGSANLQATVQLATAPWVRVVFGAVSGGVQRRHGPGCDLSGCAPGEHAGLPGTIFAGPWRPA